MTLEIALLELKKEKCTKQRLRKVYESFYVKHIAIKFMMQKN